MPAVVATTFPLALPFLLMEQGAPAMRASNAIALGVVLVALTIALDG